MQTRARIMFALVLSLGLAASVHAQPRAITNSMVVHLSFDNTLNDDSGRANHAGYVTSNGLSIFPANPTYVPGKLGQGFQFNTYSDASLIEYASLGYPADLKFGGATDFSIAFWINTYATNLGGDNAYFGNNNWNASSTLGYGIFSQAGRTTVRVHYAVTNPVTSSMNIRPATPANENLYDGAWHHLAMTMKRGVELKIYVDGVLESTTAFPASTNSFDTDTNLVGSANVPETINIGQDGTGSYNQAPGGGAALNPPAQPGGSSITNGMVDDLAIWRRLLTDLEVSTIYNFAQQGTNVFNVPDVHTPIVTSFSPPNNASGVSPYIPVSATIQNQDSALNPASVQVTVDGVSVAYTLVSTPPTTSITYTQAFLSAPGSLHTNKLIFADNSSPVPNRFTNTSVFTVIQWSNVYLPAPIYFENFDEVPVATNAPANYPTDIAANYPTGWSVSNCTALFGFWDIEGPTSDAYANFQVTPIEIITGKFNYGTRIRNFYYPLLVNGVLVTNTLASSNIVFAASDQRPNGPQLDYLFTKDYDLTGQTNVYFAYWNMFSQENGEFGGIEYSIDQGVTWLPIVYMIDPRTAVLGGGGAIDALATFTNSSNARIQPNNCSSDPNAYFGQFIGVASSLWSTLGPYISLRDGSDHVRWHIVEKFRLAQADNQPNVRFRFVFSGRDYWDWGFDNFGLYSITPTPLQISSITKSGNNVTINWNGTGANSTSGLQRSKTINPPSWADVPGTIGLSTYTDAFSATGFYYRAIRY